MLTKLAQKCAHSYKYTEKGIVNKKTISRCEDKMSILQKENVYVVLVTRRG